MISRGNRPIAHLASLDDVARSRAAVEAMIALGDSGTIKPVTQAEIRNWIREGRKEPWASLSMSP